MKHFKRKSISLLQLLILVLVLASCSEKATLTPQPDLIINSDKQITEIMAGHQVIVSVTSSKEFKFAIKDGGDWITSESEENTHAKGDSVKIIFNLKNNQSGADRSAALLFGTTDREDFTDIVQVTQTGIIMVKTPGTLAQEIKNQGLDTLKITKLTVGGTLGGVDVLCLRKMTGRDENDNKTNGQLADLDMSLVKFHPDSFIYNHFDNDYNITSADIFPAYLFADANVLKSIKLPLNINTIGNGTFFQCDHLTNINIPENIKSIGDNVFMSCSSLNSITFPEGLTSIGNAAFDECAFTSISIPASITSMKENAFAECSALKNVTIYASNPSNMKLGDNIFNEIPNTATLHVPAAAVQKYKAVQQFSSAFGGGIIAI